MAARHADHFLHVAAAAARSANERPEERIYERLEADNDNLRSSVAWCIERGDRPRALAAVASLWDFWLSRGYVAEGDRWAEQLVAVTGFAGAQEEATRSASGSSWARSPSVACA